MGWFKKRMEEAAVVPPSEPNVPTPFIASPQTARLIIEVSPRRYEEDPDVRWVVTIGTFETDFLEYKADAVEIAVAIANARLEHGHKSQVRIRKKDGTYASERTYPDETPRRPGKSR